MNHAMDAKRLLATFCVNGDEEQRARAACLIVDHIIVAAREPDGQPPSIDPNMPRRFRWHDAVTERWWHGAYLPDGNVYVTAGTCKGGKPDWPVEWIDPDPETT